MSAISEARQVQGQPQEIRHISWKEYAVRFLFGGVITAVVGVIGKAFGPVVAGLFLAFPAILPASITLVAKHEDKEAAGRDALGAAIGSVGLVAFGAIVWAGNSQIPAWVTMVGATVAWLVVGIGLWLVVQELRERG